VQHTPTAQLSHRQSKQQPVRQVPPPNPNNVIQPPQKPIDERVIVPPPLQQPLSPKLPKPIRQQQQRKHREIPRSPDNTNQNASNIAANNYQLPENCNKKAPLEQTRISEQEERQLLAELEKLNRIHVQKQQDLRNLNNLNSKHQLPNEAQPIKGQNQNYPINKNGQKKVVATEIPKKQNMVIHNNAKKASNEMVSDRSKPSSNHEVVVNKKGGMNHKEKDIVKEKEKMAFKAGAKDVRPAPSNDGNNAKHRRKGDKSPSNVIINNKKKDPPVQPMHNNLMLPEEPPPHPPANQSLYSIPNPNPSPAVGGYLQGYQKKGKVKGSVSRRDSHAGDDDGSYSGVASAYSNKNRDAYSDQGMVAAARQETSSLPAILSARINQRRSVLVSEGAAPLSSYVDDGASYDSSHSNGTSDHPVEVQSRRVDTRFGKGSRHTSTMSAPPRLRDDSTNDAQPNLQLPALPHPLRAVKQPMDKKRS